MGEDGNVIDKLEIVIESTSTDAEQSIDRLIKSLEGLKGVLDGSAFSNIADSVKDLASGFTSLKDSLSDFNSAVNGGVISKAADALKDLTNVDAGKLKEIANALSGFKGAAAAAAGAIPTGGESGLGEAQDSPLADVGGGEASVKRFRDVVAEAMQSATNHVSEFADKFKGAMSAVSGIANAVGGGIKRVFGSSFAVRTFKSAGEAVSNFGKKLGGLIPAFKRVLFYRTVRTIIKEIGDAFKEGTKNLYFWSDGIGGRFAKSMDMAATSMLYLKNSIGAMVAPLVNTLAPVLDMLIDKLVALINVVNQFFAVVTGATSWTKALKYPKAYAEETKKAGAAAKAALKYLAPFDELNVLPDQNNGGGGGGAEALDYSKMFEEQQLTGIKDQFADIFDVFKNAWESKGAETIDKMKTALGQIKDMFGAIGHSFREVFTNGTGQTTLETILSIVGNIAEAVGNLAERFRIAWETNNVGTQIIQNLWDTVNDFLGMLDRTAAATAEWASGLDFYPLLVSVESITGAFRRFSDIVRDSLEWAYTEVLLPLGKWAIEKAGPDSLDLLSTALDVLTDVIEILAPPAKWLWDNVLKPFAEWNGQMFIDMIHGATDALKGMHDILKDGGEPFIEFLNNLDLGSELSDALSGALDWLRTSGENLATAFYNLFVAGTPVNTLLQAMPAVADFLRDAIGRLDEADRNLSAGFDDAKQTISDAWDGIAATFKSGVNTVLGFAETFSNGIIDAFNGVARFLNGFKFDVPDYVPLLGGKKFDGFGLKERAHISIPRLATGGIIESGQLFIAREAGPELVGKANGKSAVMNNDDIVRSVQSGVAEANTDVVNAIMAIGNMIVQAVENQDSDVTLDGRSLASGLRPYLQALNRTHGSSLVTVH